MKLKDLLVTYGCNLKIDEILIADVNDLKNNENLAFDDFHIKIQNCFDYVHNCFVWRKIEKYSSFEVLKAFWILLQILEIFYIFYSILMRYYLQLKS